LFYSSDMFEMEARFGLLRGIGRMAGVEVEVVERLED